MEIFLYEFGILALIGGVLSAIATSLLGSVVVLRKMSFFGSGIAHLSFIGVGLALFFKLSPTFVTLTVAIAAAIILGFLARKGVHEDIGVGILFSTSMALGIILIYLAKIDNSRVMAYLFGDILAINWQDVVFSSIVTALVILYIIFFKDHIVYITFDEDFSKVLGINIPFVYYTFLILLAVSIVVSMNLLGIVLVSAMVVVPAASASLASRTYQGMFKLAPLISAFSVFFGLILSWNFDIPAGASIVLVQGIVFLFTFLVKILSR